MHVAQNSQGVPFVLIPGAGGMASYWHRVALLHEKAHQEPIAIDLPGDDASASLSDYADIVVKAIGKRANVVLVAHPLGGFTAPSGGRPDAEHALQPLDAADTTPNSCLNVGPRFRSTSSLRRTIASFRSSSNDAWPAATQ